MLRGGSPPKLEQDIHALINSIPFRLSCHADEGRHASLLAAARLGRPLRYLSPYSFRDRFLPGREAGSPDRSKAAWKSANKPVVCDSLSPRSGLKLKFFSGSQIDTREWVSI